MSRIRNINLFDANGNPITSSNDALDVALKDFDGNPYTEDNPLDVRTRPLGILDTNNSTSTPLGVGEVFTGTPTDLSSFATLAILVKSDQSGQLDVEFSNDGITFVNGESYIYIGGDKVKFFTPPAQATYYRVVYTNDGVAQTNFSIGATLKTTPIKWSSHNIDDVIEGEDDAQLVKAVLSGEGDDGMFNNVPTDLAGLLKVNSFPYTYAIAEGDILGHDSLFKFGTRTSVSSATPSSVWEGPTALYDYPATAIPLSVASTSAQDGVGGTGTRTIVVEGLDANFDMVSEIITMNGLTVVTTVNSYIRVFRAYGGECGTSYTNVGAITMKNAALTVTYLTIPAGDGQTLMTLWTVPNNKVAYLVAMTASSDTTKGARVSLFTRLAPVGAVLSPWQIKFRAFIAGGSNRWDYKIPFKIPAKTDIEVRFNTPASAGITSGGATFELWYEDA